MTIPAGNSISRWTGNGTADTFDYEFKISAAEDLLVTVYDADNVATELTLESDYTVAGVGNDKGSITLTAGPLDSGKDIVLKDNVEASQLIPFGNQSRFAARTHESAFDKNVRLVKRVLTTQERTLKMPSNLTGFDMDFPSPVAGASLRFNAAASALETFNPTFSDVTGPTHSYFMEYTDGPSGAGISGSDLSDVLGITLLADDLIRTDHYNSDRVAGSGAVLQSTGATDTNKAGNSPDADGYFYDGAGNQFQVVGTVNFEQFGAVGDGSADDLGATNAVFAQAREINSKPNKEYAVSGAISIPDDTVLALNGSRFVRTTNSPSETPCVLVGANVEVLGTLALHLPTGVQIDRGVRVSGAGSSAGKIIVTSADQQTTTDDNTDAAIIISGEGFRCGYQRVENFRNGSIVEADNVWVGDTVISSYVRGLWCDEPSNFQFGSIHAHTAAPDADMSPGHSGVLFTGVQGLEGHSIRVYDSGEHGVRFGGDPGCTDVDIGSIYTKNTGGSGTKFRSGDVDRATRFRVGSITAIDCGDASNPISNQEGVMVERMRGINIAQLIVRRQNKTYSAHQGLTLYDVQDFDISGIEIDGTNRDGIYFEPISDSTNNDINRGRLEGRIGAPGRNGVYIDYNNITLRSINFHIDMESVAASGYRITGGGAGAIAQPITVRGSIRLAGSSTEFVFSGGGLNANIYAHWIGDFDSSINIAGGSTCHDIATNDLRVLNSGGTWTALNS